MSKSFINFKPRQLQVQSLSPQTESLLDLLLGLGAALTLDIWLNFGLGLVKYFILKRCFCIKVYSEFLISDGVLINRWLELRCSWHSWVINAQHACPPTVSPALLERDTVWSEEHGATVRWIWYDVLNIRRTVDPCSLINIRTRWGTTPTFISIMGGREGGQQLWSHLTCYPPKYDTK